MLKDPESISGSTDFECPVFGSIVLPGAVLLHPMLLFPGRFSFHDRESETEAE